MDNLLLFLWENLKLRMRLLRLGMSSDKNWMDARHKLVMSIPC